MPKTTQQTITANIQKRTGLTTYKARKGLKAALESFKIALQMGKEVELSGIGRLVVVKRKNKRVGRGGLKNVGPTIVDLHKRYPKSVRLMGGKDLSEDPQPTIVHKKEPLPQALPARSRRLAVAIPSWRRRFR
jgi:nucleoid DNA-binding protein